MGGDVVTYSAPLCHNSTQGAFGDIWNRIQVIWVFDSRHNITSDGFSDDIHNFYLLKLPCHKRLYWIALGVPVMLYFMGPVMS